MDEKTIIDLWVDAYNDKDINKAVDIQKQFNHNDYIAFANKYPRLIYDLINPVENGKGTGIDKQYALSEEVYQI